MPSNCQNQNQLDKTESSDFQPASQSAIYPDRQTDRQHKPPCLRCCAINGDVAKQEMLHREAANKKGGALIEHLFHLILFVPEIYLRVHTLCITIYVCNYI